MATISKIAGDLHAKKSPITLIYAFNATGKTKLSVEYKDLTKLENGGNHNGVYYNAYSEDLFVWENDEENNNSNIHLKVLPSSLNEFHSFLLENSNLIRERLALYHPRYDFHLNPYKDLEKGIESISFSKEGIDAPIKISRGEERIFVWCFFLSLFSVDGWADHADGHIFIDDPVSSLDEHNIFITAESIFQLIEKNYKNKTILITTHHIGLFSILFDKLKKGEKSDRYRNITNAHILGYHNDELELRSHNKDVFLFHLHLLQVLESARKEKLYIFHFVLLRQILENISSFLGSGRVGFVLDQIGVKNTEEYMGRLNSLSHQNIYRFQNNEMSEAEEILFNEIFQGVLDTYQFKID